MKKITLFGFSLVTLISLSACVSDSNNETSNTEYNNPIISYSSEAPTIRTDSPSDPIVNEPSQQVTAESAPVPQTSSVTEPLPLIQTPVTETQASTPDPTPTIDLTPATNPVEEVSQPTSNANWYRVYMHYNLLKGQHHNWRDSGGYLPLNLAENAYKGSYSINLVSSQSLRPSQLLTYRGSDSEYYTATIQSIRGNTVNLSTPLEKNVWYGGNAWNFYANASHPNYRGYRAISDYAVRSLGRGNLNYGTHALLGDSWFSEGTIRSRLQESLSNATIINLGIGGHTSDDLVARFDRDVPEHNPDFVWILTGTNDYWNYISAAQYKQNIKSLIRKIERLGAKAIIIGPSVAPLNYGSTDLVELSHDYAKAIDQLQNEN